MFWRGDTEVLESMSFGDRASQRRPVTGELLAGKYRLEDCLAEGGMGLVFVAEHESIGRRVVVKVLTPRLAESPKHRERLIREARAASKIDHEHVVSIIDVGHTDHGVPFIVMEYLRGEPLTATLAREAPLSVVRVKRLGLQICRALHAAHRKGIIHRDMKPDNVFRLKRGANEDFVKVLDFGIAKVLSELAVLPTLTPAGAALGSPAYMSPEQCRGEPLDARTDVYSVGIMLYEFVAGRPPFCADHPIALFNMQVHATPDPPSKVAPGIRVPIELEQLILKALAKSPEDRFQSIRELAEALASVPSNPGEIARTGRTQGSQPQTVVSERRRDTLILAAISVQTIVIALVLAVMLALAWRAA